MKNLPLEQNINSILARVLKGTSVPKKTVTLGAEVEEYISVFEPEIYVNTPQVAAFNKDEGFQSMLIKYIQLRTGRSENVNIKGYVEGFDVQTGSINTVLLKKPDQPEGMDSQAKISINGQDETTNEHKFNNKHAEYVEATKGSIEDNPFVIPNPIAPLAMEVKGFIDHQGSEQQKLGSHIDKARSNADESLDLVEQSEDKSSIVAHRSTFLEGSSFRNCISTEPRSPISQDIRFNAPFIQGEGIEFGSYLKGSISFDRAQGVKTSKIDATIPKVSSNKQYELQETDKELAFRLTHGPNDIQERSIYSMTHSERVVANEPVTSPRFATKVVTNDIRFTSHQVYVLTDLSKAQPTTDHAGINGDFSSEDMPIILTSPLRGQGDKEKLHNRMISHLEAIENEKGLSSSQVRLDVGRGVSDKASVHHHTDGETLSIVEKINKFISDDATLSLKIQQVEPYVELNVKAPNIKHTSIANGGFPDLNWQLASDVVQGSPEPLRVQTTDDRYVNVSKPVQDPKVTTYKKVILSSSEMKTLGPFSDAKDTLVSTVASKGGDPQPIVTDAEGNISESESELIVFTASQTKPIKAGQERDVESDVVLATARNIEANSEMITYGEKITSRKTYLEVNEGITRTDNAYKLPEAQRPFEPLKLSDLTGRVSPKSEGASTNDINLLNYNSMDKDKHQAVWETGTGSANIMLQKSSIARGNEKFNERSSVTGKETDKGALLWPSANEDEQMIINPIKEASREDQPVTKVLSIGETSSKHQGLDTKQEKTLTDVTEKTITANTRSKFSEANKTNIYNARHSKDVSTNISQMFKTSVSSIEMEQDTPVLQSVVSSESVRRVPSVNAKSQDMQAVVIEQLANSEQTVKDTFQLKAYTKPDSLTLIETKNPDSKLFNYFATKVNTVHNRSIGSDARLSETTDIGSGSVKMGQNISRYNDFEELVMEVVSSPEKQHDGGSSQVPESFSDIILVKPDVTTEPDDVSDIPFTLVHKTDRQINPQIVPEVEAFAKPEDVEDEFKALRASETEGNIGHDYESLFNPSSSAVPSSTRYDEPELTITSRLPELPDNLRDLGVVDLMSDTYHQATEYSNVRINSILVQLEPAQLGKIKFKVTLKGNTVYAEMDVTNPDTAALIEGMIPKIKQALAQNNVELVSVFVSLNDDNRRSYEPDFAERFKSNSQNADLYYRSYQRDNNERRQNRYLRHNQDSYLIDILM